MARSEEYILLFLTLLVISLIVIGAISIIRHNKKINTICESIMPCIKPSHDIIPNNDSNDKTRKCTNSDNINANIGASGYSEHGQEKSVKPITLEKAIRYRKQLVTIYHAGLAAS